ncbi:MAG TPA: maltose alpha-D-glucosyltransferase [Acidimicrobiales bacterium]|nr:maltose alpha-D-glucosyltransferase [Acidimicrobiales bacterium]
MSARRRDLGPAPDPLWYKDAVLYEVHVRAFADSNGDGVGDFRGLIGKLDYLRELGVTALWLLPFYPSPLRDDGYDIADYRRVHPAYGTLTDFRALLREAHARGLRVITELVLAHTSDEHPWFTRARAAPAGSVERDFYVWSDTPDRYREARVIFKDFETSNWAFDSAAGAYYWHRFYSHQPSLNYDNPAVRAAMVDVVDYWLEMGVDGLRLDAVPYLYAREGTTCENLPETFAFLRELRAHVDAHFPNRMLLAEANQWPEDAVAYLEGACHMAFHFPLMPRIFMAARQEDRFPIVDILTETPPIPPESQWALFLRNHDELTLEMVTDEERDYMYRTYAEDPQARLNVGIRRRLAPLLGNDRNLIEMMLGLLFSLPGTPIIYYGDEIGMGDNIYLGDRNGVRTPMQWDGDRNAGFSNANPQRLYLPVVIDPEYHAQSVNVAAQEENPSSLLWWMRRLVALRNRYRAFSRGDLEILLPENRKVFAFLRRLGDETLLVVVNLSRFTQCVSLDLQGYLGAVPVELFGGTEFPPIGDLPYFITLGPHGFYWFAIEASVEQAEPQPPHLEVPGRFTDVFSGAAKLRLEGSLVDYLPRRRWYRDKARRIRRVTIDDVVGLPHAERPSEQVASLLFLHVAFDQGAPEDYLVPAAFATGERAEDLRRHHPESLLSELRSGGEEGVLFDATYDPELAAALVRALGRRRQLLGTAGRISTVPAPAFTRLTRGIEADAPSQLIGGDQSNSSIVLANRLVVKLLRRVEPGINPDVELGRFLHERARFAHSPVVAGHLERRSDGASEASCIAVVQEYVQNEGDGFSYVLDALLHGLEEAVAHRDPEELIVHVPSRLLDVAMQAPDSGHPLIGPHLQWAELLGRRTGEMHRALASGPYDPAIVPQQLTAIDRQAMLHGARSLMRSSFRAVRALPERHPVITEVLAAEGEIRARLDLVREGSSTAWKIRCHGDYHLGQVLWTGRDFTIIDFEGEPARSISTRRLRRPALTDVAGMLRSVHYVASVAATRLSRDLIPGRDPSILERLLLLWYRSIAGAFLTAYLEVSWDAPFLPEGREELENLLDFLLLEKALYELGYEANSRPEWVTIPAQGILELLGHHR